MLIENGLVFTEKTGFRPLHIRTGEDRILSLFEKNSSEISGRMKESSEVTVDASGCYVLPGLTDIHFHGCMGRDFCNEESVSEDIKLLQNLEAIGKYELSKGVTSICPATMSLPEEMLSAICRGSALFKHAQETGSYADVAELVGIHLEGPFLNTQKKGAQNGAYLRLPETTLLHKLQEEAGGLIRLVTLAPELDGTLPCISECRNLFHFSLGHTDADYDVSMAAFLAGADHITHLYNAMPPFLHRAPGPIGAAFDTPECFVELICDGIHNSSSAVRAAFKLFSSSRLVLISDSMEAAGLSDGRYRLGGQDVIVKEKTAVLANGSLAGSVVTLYDCLCNAVSIGIPLEDAVCAATINPCRSIGIDDLYGSIEIGKKAHFLLLNQKDLSIRKVIKGQFIL
ncbi:MAG: N-acetylglucosamine-6-phosphate deacetylase [Lachnospiraceae bacterium]|nr:N-acetylglucosamine-6-phosphate deacetylase [Lachnospiraceae bacterium]